MKAAIDAIVTSYYNVKFRYVLAPIYLANYTCGKKTHTVAINGQTGKTYCEVPTFMLKLVLIPLLIMIVVLVLFFFLMVLPELR